MENKNLRDILDEGGFIDYREIFRSLELNNLLNPSWPFDDGYEEGSDDEITSHGEWLRVLKKAPKEGDEYMPILLVASKLDLELEGKRVIEREFAREYGKKRNLFNFIECSSKTGENIENVFNTITNKMLILADLL